jgi:carboxymethylenebutenolidase
MSNIKLTARDSHVFDAWAARPTGAPLAGVVVIQEIFGVNPHIRSVADGYASAGYLAVAPALFDRVRPGVELAYNDVDRTAGFGLKNDTGNENPLLDIAASVAWLRSQGVRKVGVVGYCWGGLLTWLSATRVDGVDAAVPYYGGGMPDFAGEQAKCPVLAHFADQDMWIPAEGIAAFKAAQANADPHVEVHLYHAHHGFNRDGSVVYEPNAAMLARERTLGFFRAHLT